jgi:hypothetical protein
VPEESNNQETYNVSMVRQVSHGHYGLGKEVKLFLGLAN